MAQPAILPENPVTPLAIPAPSLPCSYRWAYPLVHPVRGGQKRFQYSMIASVKDTAGGFRNERHIRDK